jgi:hypothetical protein
MEINEHLACILSVIIITTAFLTWGADGWCSLWLHIIDRDGRKQHLKLSQNREFTPEKEDETRL